MKILIVILDVLFGGERDVIIFPFGCSAVFLHDLALLEIAHVLLVLNYSTRLSLKKRCHIQRQIDDAIIDF